MIKATFNIDGIQYFRRANINFVLKTAKIEINSLSYTLSYTDTHTDTHTLSLTHSLTDKPRK